jgi:hypothetical protein
MNLHLTNNKLNFKVIMIDHLGICFKGLLANLSSFKELILKCVFEVSSLVILDTCMENIIINNVII